MLLLREFCFYFCAPALPGSSASRYLPPSVRRVSLLLFSSDKRLRLLLPGLGLAACPPLVVDLPLWFPCCSILGSCHPALEVLRLLLAHCSVDSIASVIRPIKGCGCRRPIKGCGLPPRAGGLCCFKFIRILVWGTCTNSACKRSGRCYADIRLLLLDAYYCQPIARNSVPSFRLYTVV